MFGFLRTAVNAVGYQTVGNDGFMKKERMKKILLIGLYVVFLLWGLLSYKDYGISWDEPSQRIHGLVNFKYVYELIHGNTNILELLAGLPELEEYSGKYYGIGLKIPLLLIEYYNNFQMTKQQIYYMNHLYTFLLFFIASIFVYKIARKAGLEYSYAMLAVVLFMVCPRILADAFYNIKDSAFLSTFVIMLYFGLSVLNECKIKYMLGLAISAAFCLNTRIIGALPLFIVCIVYILKDRKADRKRFFHILLIGIASLIIYFLIAPASWGAPFEYLYNVACTFSNYDHIVRLGLGNSYYQSDQLPWYYTVLCICLTMPNLYLLFGAVGILAGWKEFKKNILIYVMYAQFLSIILYDAVMQPVKYNMWRHFYFLFIYIVIFTVIGVRYAVKKLKKYRRVVTVYIGISLSLIMIWILTNHPYEYLYFNPLYAVNEAEVTERDYWHVSGQNLLAAIEDDDNINVSGQDIHKMFFGESGWENYHENKETYSAEYIVTFQDTNNQSNICYKEIENVRVNGRKSSSLLKRQNYNNCVLKYFMSDNGTVTGNNNAQEIEWDYSENEGERCLKAYIPENYNIRQVDFLMSETDGISNIKLYTSMDAEHWYQRNSNFTANNMFSVLSENALPQYLMVKYSAQKSVDFAIRLYGQKSSDISYIESEYGYEDLKYLFDGNIDTRWTSYVPQNQKMYLEFGLCREQEVQGIVLKKGSSVNDYSRKLQIQYKDQDGSFKDIPYIVDDDMYYEFIQPVRCSVIRLKNLDNQESWYWSIHEIELVFKDICSWTYADTKNTIEDLKSFDGKESIWNIIDNNIDSVWSTEQTQNKEMYVDFKVKSVSPVFGLYINSGNRIMENARGIEIYGSYDGNDWSKINYSYSSAYEYIFDSVYDYRYYRIRQTEEDNKYPWSIAEIGILRSGQAWR